MVSTPMTASRNELADQACESTDRELWRGPDEGNGDFYADSIHVTRGGGIGINVGGYVFVKTLRAWHALARAADTTQQCPGCDGHECPPCQYPGALRQPQVTPSPTPTHIRDRWNIEWDGADLLICFNEHEKGDGCQFERYVPADKITSSPSPSSGEPVAWLCETPDRIHAPRHVYLSDPTETMNARYGGKFTVTPLYASPPSSRALEPVALAALRTHQMWSKREAEGPLYPFGMKRDDPGGEAIWRAWWNDQLRLCDEAHRLTDEALALYAVGRSVAETKK